MGLTIIQDENETYQVLEVNLCAMFLIANGLISKYPVDDGIYDPSGEVFLYQVKTEPKDRLKTLYEEMKSEMNDAEPEDLPSYEDLLDFDELIFCKAKYQLGATDENGKRIMNFTETIPLDQYMTINENGDIEDVKM